MCSLMKSESKIAKPCGRRGQYRITRRIRHTIGPSTVFEVLECSVIDLSTPAKTFLAFRNTAHDESGSIVRTRRVWRDEIADRKSYAH